MKIVILSIFLTLFGCTKVVKPLGGNFELDVDKAKESLSLDAKKFLEDIFKDVDKKCFLDTHVHAVGLGAGGTNNWVNPEMSKLSNFMEFIRYNVYMSSGGITDEKKADQQYIERLVKLATSQPRYGKLFLFAFSHHHDDDGKVNLKNSNFHIPNQYVYDMSLKYPNVFIPVISVHPYKKDVLNELESWAQKGVRFIKWLPNAMNIDPSSERVKPFYEVMKKYDMVLISHGGEEKAVHAEEFQKLGNPLRLRTPLDMGVKVIIAHAASRGQCADTDNGDVMVHCFDLFWRLFNNPKYEKNLFSDLSAVTIHARIGKPLEVLINNPEKLERFMHGSDYPLPAVNFIYRTGQLKDLGYITDKEREILNEIYKYNPLVFDYAFKRALRDPKSGKRFPLKAFHMPKELGCEF